MCDLVLIDDEKYMSHCGIRNGIQLNCSNVSDKSLIFTRGCVSVLKQGSARY